MNAQTKVSAKGQIVIPKAVRDELNWPVGTRLEVERVGGALTLRPLKSAAGTLSLDEFIVRRPRYEGRPLSLEEIDAAVARGMGEQFKKVYKIER